MGAYQLPLKTGSGDFVSGGASIRTRLHDAVDKREAETRLLIKGGVEFGRSGVVASTIVVGYPEGAVVDRRA